jgi:DNA-binding response OmpR family regulator
VRILLAEDDEHMAGVLRQGLEEEGFVVEVVTTGGEALTAGLTTDFDVISLDVMLPELDGFDVCRELRRHRVPTPVLMLTARDALHDRVHGLDVGADDYLVKPFAFEELLARLRALSRRHLAQRRAVIEVGDILLDTSAHLVTVAGRRLTLTAKELRILEYLMLNAGRLLSRGQIADHTWGYEFSSESNLVDVYVARLRRKLEAEGVDQPIETVRHGGYRFRLNPRCTTSSGTPASA